MNRMGIFYFLPKKLKKGQKEKKKYESILFHDFKDRKKIEKVYKPEFDY